MLTDAALERILQRIPELTIGVLGDLFLDRYLEIDAELTEPSLETGLDAYQVVRVRSNAGAAGTVLNNLVALGVKQAVPITVIGDDGEGHELLQALSAMRSVELDGVQVTSQRRTPTYTKPMLHEPGRVLRELNRLDIKNRQPMPVELQQGLMVRLHDAWPRLDALIALDQVGEPECGVLTTAVRETLGLLGEADSDRLILVDSREHIGLFRHVATKPNCRECLAATGEATVDAGIRQLARQNSRPVFCTAGGEGIFVALPTSDEVVHVPAYAVSGPIDVVGAGDSTSAAIACACAAGMSLTEAAAFGNLVASITIQQLGTTGTASPQQVRQRWEALKRVADCGTP